MHHQIVNINEYLIRIDYTVEKTLKPFKEEVLDQLYNTYTLNGNMPLLFSGGMDSTFLLRSLLELGIKPRTLTMSFSREHDTYDCNLVRERCRQYGLKDPEFFYIDKEKFFEHINYLLFERSIAYPMLHGFYISYLLSTYSNDKFFTGMGSEFKLYDNLIKMPQGPQLVKQNNPNRLYDFATSRTFLSYLNHERFDNDYKTIAQRLKETKLNPFYLRNKIYTDCYNDIITVEKQIPDDGYIQTVFYPKFTPLIKDSLPLTYLTTPYYFNIDDYFKRKKDKNDS